MPYHVPTAGIVDVNTAITNHVSIFGGCSSSSTVHAHLFARPTPRPPHSQRLLAPRKLVLHVLLPTLFTSTTPNSPPYLRPDSPTSSAGFWSQEGLGITNNDLEWRTRCRHYKLAGCILPPDLSLLSKMAPKLKIDPSRNLARPTLITMALSLRPPSRTMP
jgi:hypothetical protein